MNDDDQKVEAKKRDAEAFLRTDPCPKCGGHYVYYQQYEDAYGLMNGHQYCAGCNRRDIPER